MVPSQATEQALHREKELPVAKTPLFALARQAGELALTMQQDGLRSIHAKSTPNDLLAGDGLHLRGDIGGVHVGDAGGKGEGGVAGRGGDIERLPVGLRLYKLDQPLQAGTLGVGPAGDISTRMGAELLLY